MPRSPLAMLAADCVNTLWQCVALSRQCEQDFPETSRITLILKALVLLAEGIQMRSIIVGETEEPKDDCRSSGLSEEECELKSIRT